MIMGAIAFGVLTAVVYGLLEFRDVSGVKVSYPSSSSFYSISKK